MVGRFAGELGSARVNGFKSRHHAEQLAARAHRHLVGTREVRDLRIGKPHALEQAKRVDIQLVQAHAAQVFLYHHDIAHAADEPRVNARASCTASTVQPRRNASAM